MVETTTIEALVPDPDESAVGSVLISPDHDTVQQAIASDVIDAIPLVGDTLLVVRSDIAEREGINFPDDQVAIQNAISDLPPPFGHLLNAASSPNTVKYVEDNEPVEVRDGLELQVFEDETLGLKVVLPAIVESPVPDPADYLPV